MTTKKAPVEAASKPPVSSLTDPSQLTPATDPSQSSTETQPESKTPVNENVAERDDVGGEQADEQAQPTRDQVKAYLKKHPEEIGTLLGDLDESAAPEQEEGQREFIKQYLHDNPDFASEVTKELTSVPATPAAATSQPAGNDFFDDAADAEPATEPAVAEDTPEPKASGPGDSFPVEKVYGEGRDVKVNLGNVTVSGTVAGIYHDTDGLFYQVSVHIADGVPARGTKARTAKIEVAADLVSA